MIIKERTRNQNLSVGVFKCKAVLDTQVVAPSVDLAQFILLSEKLLCLQCSYYRACGPLQQWRLTLCVILFSPSEKQRDLFVFHTHVSLCAIKFTQL